VYERAEEYLVPLYGTPTGIHGGDVPWTHRAVELGGDHTLVLSACKKAEDRDELVLRFWNVAGEPTTARVYVIGARVARLLNLAEQALPEDDLPVDRDGTFMVRAGPAEIVTVGVERL
jgi:mannosylglycerate hydrolase